MNASFKNTDTTAEETKGASSTRTVNINEKVDIMYSIVGEIEPPTLPIHQEYMTGGFEVVFNAKGVGQTILCKEQRRRKDQLLEKIKEIENKLYNEKSCNLPAQKEETEREMEKIRDLRIRLENNSASCINYETYSEELERVQDEGQEIDVHDYINHCGSESTVRDRLHVMTTETLELAAISTDITSTCTSQVGKAIEERQTVLIIKHLPSIVDRAPPLDADDMKNAGNTLVRDGDDEKVDQYDQIAVLSEDGSAAVTSNETASIGDITDTSMDATLGRSAMLDEGQVMIDTPEYINHCGSEITASVANQYMRDKTQLHTMTTATLEPAAISTATTSTRTSHAGKAIEEIETVLLIKHLPSIIDSAIKNADNTLVRDGDDEKVDQYDQVAVLTKDGSVAFPRSMIPASPPTTSFLHDFDFPNNSDSLLSNGKHLDHTNSTESSLTSNGTATICGVIDTTMDTTLDTSTSREVYSTETTQDGNNNKPANISSQTAPIYVTREIIFVSFVAFLTLIGHLVHRDAQINALELQISQNKFMNNDDSKDKTLGESCSEEIHAAQNTQSKKNSEPNTSSQNRTIRIAREVLFVFFTSFLIFVGYLSYRDTHANALKLQITQIELMVQTLQVQRDARAYELMRSMQHNSAIDKDETKRANSGPIDAFTLDPYLPSSFAPTPCIIEHHHQDFAPTAIARQERVKKSKVRKFDIPMQDFFFVQSMLD